MEKDEKIVSMAFVYIVSVGIHPSETTNGEYYIR